MPPSDETSWGDRLAAVQGRLRLLLLHLAGPAVRARVEVDDLVQEVYLRAVASREAPPPESPDEAELFRWLRRLARNTVIDVVRAARAAKRDGRERRLERSSWSRTGLGRSSLADPGPGPRTRIEGREAAERLTRAFEALDPEHRRVLGLRQFEGLSAREAAARMGRSEKAVHSLYRRALERWQELSGGD